MSQCIATRQRQNPIDSTVPARPCTDFQSTLRPLAPGETLTRAIVKRRLQTRRFGCRTSTSAG
jgi:hypothetical protein